MRTFDLSLGQLVTVWRMNSGMSQAALANALGTQQASISKIENGIQRITVAQLSRILCACGLTFSAVSKDLDAVLVRESRSLWERETE